NARSSGTKLLFTTLEVLAMQATFAREERDLLESFRSLDTEGLGEVTLEELQHGLLQAVPTWTARELSQVIAYVSRGGQDRVITFRRFVACCLDLEEPAVAERLRIIFHRFPRRGLEIRASWPDSGPSGFFESWAQGASTQQADTEKVEDLATRLQEELTQQLHCKPKL
ncbi:unnamed protein product, partial [Effrenium voratum]